MIPNPLTDGLTAIPKPLLNSLEIVAKYEAPKEAVAFIHLIYRESETSYRYVWEPCLNTHEQPERNFRVRRSELISALSNQEKFKSDLILFHSHTSGSQDFSEIDKQMMITLKNLDLKMSWLLYHVPSKTFKFEP